MSMDWAEQHDRNTTILEEHQFRTCLNISNGNKNITLNPVFDRNILHGLDISYYVLTIFTSLLSIAGAVTIIWTFFRIPELQTRSRKLLVYLSCSDLVLAAGNLVGVIWTLVVVGDDAISEIKNDAFRIFNSTDVEDGICRGQAAVSSTASLMSFFWTFFIALNLYLSVVRQNDCLTKRLRVIPHIVSWGFPLIILFVTLSMTRYGFNYCAKAAWWCWIQPKENDHQYDLIIWQLISGKLWEILSYVFVCALYGVVVYDISEYVKRLQDHSGESTRLPSSSQTPLQRSSSSAIAYANKKLKFVPLVFIIARIWGTLRFLLDLIQTEEAKTAAAILAPLQGVGDSAQGFLNCIVFIFTTPSIRDQFPCRRIKIMLRSSQSDTVGEARRGERELSSSTNSRHIDGQQSEEITRDQRSTIYGSTRVSNAGNKSISAKVPNGNSVRFHSNGPTQPMPVISTSSSEDT